MSTTELYDNIKIKIVSQHGFIDKQMGKKRKKYLLSRIYIGCIIYKNHENKTAGSRKLW